MKTIALLLFTILLTPIAAQVKDNLTLVNEFDPRQGCETFEYWLDIAFVEASNDSESKVTVVIHQGNNAFDSSIVHRKAHSYVHYRGFPTERYKVLLTKNIGDISVKIWVGKNGNGPVVAPSKLDTTLPPNIPRIRIIEDTLEIVEIDGKGAYIGTGNPSCLYFFGPWIIAEVLKANSAFNAELRIKAKSTTTYRTLVKLVKNEFLESGITAGRLKFIYLGRDKDLEHLDGKYASISAFFVKQVRSKSKG